MRGPVRKVCIKGTLAEERYQAQTLTHPNLHDQDQYSGVQQEPAKSSSLNPETLNPKP